MHQADWGQYIVRATRVEPPQPKLKGERQSSPSELVFGVKLGLSNSNMQSEFILDLLREVESTRI